MKATKLPSGKYRARAYDFKDKDGKQHYKSFTAETKKEAELLATQYEAQKNNVVLSPSSMTLGEAVDKYIETNRGILSETTLHAYEVYRKYAFVDLMLMRLNKINNLVLRDAVSKECQRKTQKNTQISAKTVHNEFSLIESTLKVYAPQIDTKVPLPRKEKKIVNIPQPEVIFEAVKGTDIELAVLLSMWLSFSLSEIKGLKRSSIHGDSIQIDQVMVRVGAKEIEKKLAKVDTRTRKHRIPPYIMQLIDQIPPSQEYLVKYTGSALTAKFDKILKENDIPHISFHKLRHINASVMLTKLGISEKVAQERGGWSTDHTMKSVYTHSFTQDRIEADDKIDRYFSDIVGMKRPFPKYEDFIEFMDLKNCDEVKNIYKDLIQYKND